MFINNKEKGQEKERPEGLRNVNWQSYLYEYKNLFFFVIFLVFVLLLLAISFYYYQEVKNNNSNPNSKNNQAKNVSVNNFGALPSDLHQGNGSQNGNSFDVLRVEELLYGKFYQKPNIDFEIRPLNYTLPINTKREVVNFYDVTRKINLDSYINKLDNEGSVLMVDPFREESDNFISAYKSLEDKNLPIMITSDYLLYYYQNTLKKIYKDIEKDVFYYSVWDAGKDLFSLANNRYKNRFERTGIKNEVVLEAERQEAAYLAVLLKILSPQSDQIDDNKAITGEKFSSSEASLFEFEIPKYLKDDTERELEFIKKASSKNKSPIFRYQIDYSQFKVPDNYNNKAKLNNFYLASKWLNMLFPLYYQSSECPECLLDNDYWKINFTASCFLAKDLFNSQEAKLKWAKIYKLMSFFAGLRNELTYFEYHKSFKELFGDNYNIEEIFSDDNPKREENYKKIQEKIAAIKFEKLRGGFERGDSSQLAKAGFKFLQDNYWPDEYIFHELSYPRVGEYLGKEVKKDDFSAAGSVVNCQPNNKGNYRCGVFGQDIINLIFPLSNSNNYFIINTNYKNYQEQSAGLKRELADFNLNSWHSNNFWTMLYAEKEFLNRNKAFFPAYFKTDAWREKEINTSLGSWVNLKLAGDTLGVPSAQKGLAEIQEVNKYNYIEPNIDLVNEILADIKMLNDMSLALELDYETPDLKPDLDNLIEDFSKIKEIIIKELQGEELSNDDCYTIKNFVNFEVKTESQKSFKLSVNRGYLVESINGIKLLAVVRQTKNGKVLVFGPVFNYQERSNFKQ